MDQAVLDFLKNHRVSVFSLMRDEHSIDSATLHYAHSDDPLAFYFLTDRESRKAQPLLGGGSIAAALVVGFDENESTTFQAEGTVSMLSSEASEEGWTIYLEKHPERKDWKENPNIIVLKFTPSWWRYTDMKTKPKTVISSD